MTDQPLSSGTVTDYSKIADDLERLCCAETEGKFFDYVTDSIGDIIKGLRGNAQAVPEPAKKALEWYAAEAMAAARYLAEGKEQKAGALLAVLTVLANDNGRRASDALAVSSTEGK
jgi:hypothetical protein